MKIRIIHAGVGAINESDVLLASASNAIIIAFNVRPDRNAEEIATRERVDIRLHSVIYNVTDEMKKAMTGLLEPTFKEVRMGIAEVRNTFKVPKFGTIAGCMVTEGRITRAGDTQARLLRDNVVVYEGKIGSLRRFKDDVSEVKTGFECGIGFERFNDIKVGDLIEVFAMERGRTVIGVTPTCRSAGAQRHAWSGSAHGRAARPRRPVAEGQAHGAQADQGSAEEVQRGRVGGRSSGSLAARGAGRRHSQHRSGARRPRAGQPAADEIERVEPGLMTRTEVEFLSSP